MEIEQMGKKELLIAIQGYGKEVNPGKNKEELRNILLDLKTESSSKENNGVQKSAQPETTTEQDSSPVMEVLNKMMHRFDDIDRRLNRVENGGVNEYKEHAKNEDVERAAGMNSKVDKRIVDIVEKTLGVDFGVEVTTFPDKPGILLTILVPQRVSPVVEMFRPVKDPETGEIMRDPKSQREIEEKYWPGDRRSVAMGANDSFDVVQKHVNRIRAFIVATYQKSNRPQPQFNLAK